MSTIIIKMDSQKLIHPNLDMRYTIPDYIQEYTKGKITDNGYDYVNESGTELAVWLDAEDAAAQVENVIFCLKTKRFCGNDLSQTVQIYISDQDSAELKDCKEIIFTRNKEGEQPLPDYIKVSTLEEQNHVEVKFMVEAPKPFALGKKLKEIDLNAKMNGYHWGVLLEYGLERELPDLLEGMETDCEEDCYTAFYENTPENQKRAGRLADLIGYWVEDEEDLCKMVLDAIEYEDGLEWD